MISGGSLVRKDVPPFKAAKEPLSYVGINSVGLRRRGLQRRKLKKFKIFTEFYIKKIITPHKR
jgi:UDP-N-acetylglucosamine acyltransferase